jgi:4-hydroxy-tetrahydrodipicolinate reductase
MNTPARTRVAIAGAAGRMGRTLIEAALADPSLQLVAALEMPGHPALGRDAGEALGVVTGVALTDDVPAAFLRADCLVDFTRPAATLAALDHAVQAGKAMVIGTTGFSAEEKQRIEAAASRIPVVFAPNMAVGVNALFKLAGIAASILGDDFDVEIIESHHRHKVDAPSGTALRLGEAVAQALGRDLEAVAVHGREGITGERERASIGFHAVRGGDIVGEHTVLFAGMGERIELSVRSSSRLTYASGAMRAVRFAAGHAPGLFDMQDVLGLD